MYTCTFMLLIGNEFGEPVIEERQIRIMEQPFMKKSELCVWTCTCVMRHNSLWVWLMGVSACTIYLHVKCVDSTVLCAR